MRIKTSIVFTVWLILVLVYAASQNLLSIQSLSSGWASISAELSTSFDKHKSYPFTVQTFPQNATVRIMNIKPMYRQGMLLAPGKYHLNVSAPGHLARDLWVNHQTAPGVFSVTLVDADK